MTTRKAGAGPGGVDSKAIEAYFTTGPAVFYTMTLTPSAASADWVSPNVLDVLGYTQEEALQPGWWWSHLDEAQRGAVAAASATLFRTGALEHEYRFRKRSGEWIWVFDDLRIIERRDDGTCSAIGTWVDISASKRREAQLALALEVSQVGLYEIDLDTLSVVTNDHYPRMLGHAPDDFHFSNDNWQARLHPDDRERATAAFWDYVGGRSSTYRNEFRLQTAHGAYISILSVGRIIEHHPDGRPRRMVGSHTDISAVKASTEQARLRQELLDQLGVGVVMCDAAGRLTLFNRVAQHWHGAPPEGDVPSQGWAQRYDLYEWDGVTRLTPEKVPLYRALAGEFVQDAPMAILTDGHLRLLRTNAGPIINDEGQRIGALAVMHDVTSMVNTERILRLQMAALEAAANAIVITDRSGGILWANKAFTLLTGFSLDEAAGRNPRELVRSDLTPREVYTSMWSTIVSGATWTGEVINRRKDGSTYPESLTISPVQDARGEITHFIAIKRDLTEERKLAMRVHQAEKMEVIGRLAGGVAHDFNNLLTVINGGLDLALEDLDVSESKLRRELEEVRQASERATTLTRQLLAFGRQQVMRTERLELRVVVGELLRMLERLLGERISISAHLSGAGQILVDKGQLEQVIVNLVVNARDAMPDGGTLSIVTEERQVRPADIPGAIHDARAHSNQSVRPFAVLRVADNGSGMSPEVLAHLFEPFFTTKPLGKGTGLGLPMALGIVAQSGGFMSVQSVPGQGSTFEVYLPLESEASLARPTERTLRPGPSPSAQRLPTAPYKATILLVDDEDALRRVTTRILKKVGYEVIEAHGGEEALVLCAARSEPVDLLITDVVMPRMTGSELVAQLEARYPSVPVIYTSGYNTDMVVRHGVASERVHFIAKPYSANALLELVAKVLAERASAKPS